MNKKTFLTMRDSRGKQSKTLFFVTISFMALLVKFFFAELNLPIVGTLPPMPAADFGMAAGAVLAIWVGREWKDKEYA